MEVRTTSIEGVMVFVPTPHHDDRGLFTRTFDASIAVGHGVDAATFVQDSQSRSRYGVIARAARPVGAG